METNQTISTPTPSRSLQVDISYKVKTIVLADYYTLMDVAYIYTWKRVSESSNLIWRTPFPYISLSP